MASSVEKLCVFPIVNKIKMVSSLSSSSSSSSSSNSKVKVHNNEGPHFTRQIVFKKISWFIFFFQGLALLFPWNMFATARMFFSARFKGSYFADNFNNYFALTFMLTNAMSVVLLTFLGWDEGIKPNIRVRLGLILAFLCFTFLSVSPFILDINPDTFFALVMVTIVVLGVSTGLLNKALFTLSSNFPSVFTQALMSGQAFAGVIVGFMSVFTAALGRSPKKTHEAVVEMNNSPEDVKISGFLYFLFATLVLGLSLGLFIYLEKSKLYKHFMSNTQLFSRESRYSNISTDSRVEFVAAARISNGCEESSDKSETRGGVVNGNVSALFILKRTFWFCCSIFVIFFATLTVFPAIISSIVSERNFSLLPEFSILSFNVGDFLGKSLPAFDLIINLHNDKNDRYLFGSSFVRLLFIPFFMICNIVLKDSVGNVIPSYIEPLIKSDMVMLLSVLVFGIINGYVGSVLMLRAPPKASSLYSCDEKKGKARQLSSSIMISFLCLGLTTGAINSFAMRAVICRCNPFVS